MTGTLTRIGAVRTVAADAHEGPTYLADEDALYVTTTGGPAGTSIDPTTAEARAAWAG